MTVPVVVRWTPVRREVALAARTARRSAPFAVRHGVQLASELFLVVLVVLQALGLHVWPAMGVPVANLLLNATMQDRVAWLRPAIQQPAEAVLDGDGIRLNRRHAYPWSAVGSVVETAEQFVLVSVKERNRFVAYLPKRAIEDLDLVRAALEEHGDVRPG